MRRMITVGGQTIARATTGFLARPLTCRSWIAPARLTANPCNSTTLNILMLKLVSKVAISHCVYSNC